MTPVTCALGHPCATCRRGDALRGAIERWYRAESAGEVHPVGQMRFASETERGAPCVLCGEPSAVRMRFAPEDVAGSALCLECCEASRAVCAFMGAPRETIRLRARLLAYAVLRAVVS